MRNLPLGVPCPVHALPAVVTQSGLQHVCVQPDCEFYVRLSGPRKEDTVVTKQQPLATVPANADKKARAEAIAAAAAKKKEQPAPPPPAEKPKKPKAPDAAPKKDADSLSVSDVARELGIDPKRARAKLRAGGKSAVEGRWEKVRRDSKAHRELVAILSPKEPAPDGDADDEE